MEIKIIEDKKIWENFLLECKEKTFLQSWNWGEFNKLMGNKIWRIGIFKKEKKTSFLALISKIKAKRGTFLLIQHLLKPEKTEFFEVLLKKLKEIAKNENCAFIRIVPLWERSNENIKFFKDLGFRKSPMHANAYESTWKLDITLSEESLLMNMRKTTRYLIRQAQKDVGIKTFQSKDINDVEKFYNLHLEVARKQKFVPFSLTFLKNEFLAFQPEDQVLLFFGKYKDKVIASAFVIFWSNIAFYHHAALLPQYHKIPIIYLLQWEAIKEAKEIDKKMFKCSNVQMFKLPLAGIPIAIKDIFCTKGIKTTAGAKVLANYVPVYDATAVARLKKAGAIIVGKTNLDAWAHGSSGENSDFGPTKNPWNLEYTPGGSSSGSAAAVTAGFALAATGTDTGGSIRLPASFCNLVGLKPTYGRVSRYGVIAMASSLDAIGHFAKTVEDVALILKITAGKDNFDATTAKLPVPDYFSLLNKKTKKVKIGIPKEYFGRGLAKKVEEKVNRAIKVFKKLNYKIMEVSLPHTQYALACYYIIQPSEVSSNLARYDGIRFGFPREKFSDEAKRRIMLGTYTLSAGYYEAYYLQAMKVRTLIQKDFQEVFKKVDILLTPVSPTPPFKLGEKKLDPLAMYLSDVSTVTANLAGIPGLALPAGFVDGLPIGIQLLGPQFSEDLLFKTGYEYEKETEFYKINPSL